MALRPYPNPTASPALSALTFDDTTVGGLASDDLAFYCSDANFKRQHDISLDRLTSFVDELVDLASLGDMTAITAADVATWAEHADRVTEFPARGANADRYWALIVDIYTTCNHGARWLADQASWERERQIEADKARGILPE